MRIWIVNHYAIPSSYAGGTRHYNFALQLQKKGHEVLIIAANYNHLSHAFMPTSDKYGEVDTTYAVPFIWLSVPAYKGNTIARFWNMLLFSWRIRKNKFLLSSSPPDIIIGSSPHLFAALGAQLLAKKLKKPFMLEIRDLWPESLVDLGKFSHQHPLIKIMKKIELFLYKNADHIISLLPSANNYLIECGVKAENITWIPNSVDIKAIPFHSLTKTTNSKFTVMYAGAHGLANDLDTVIFAAKILHNKGIAGEIRICLIGDGPDKLRLKKLAESENVTLVEFIDSVSKKEIYSVLNQADAFLMLLKKSPVFRWGISPNKLFDYLAMERPIIFGVETPFNPIEKYNAGVSITPSDPNSLAEAINKLFLLSKEELIEMGKRGKEFVLEHHDISRLTNTLETVMMKVCDAKACAHSKCKIAISE